MAEQVKGSIRAVSRTRPFRPGHDDHRARTFVPRLVAFILIEVEGQPLEKAIWPPPSRRRSSKAGAPPGIADLRGRRRRRPGRRETVAFASPRPETESGARPRRALRERSAGGGSSTDFIASAIIS